MSVRFSRPVGNWLLDALPEQEFGRLLDDLRPVSLFLGEVIYEPGGQMDHAYFPTTFHASLLYTMINGATAEMGLVGNEGVLGVALFMGGETTTNQLCSGPHQDSRSAQVGKTRLRVLPCGQR